MNLIARRTFYEVPQNSQSILSINYLSFVVHIQLNIFYYIFSLLVKWWHFFKSVKGSRERWYMSEESCFINNGSDSLLKIIQFNYITRTLDITIDSLISLLSLNFWVPLLRALRLIKFDLLIQKRSQTILQHHKAQFKLFD